MRDGKGVTDAIPKWGVGKGSQLWTCQASVSCSRREDAPLLVGKESQGRPVCAWLAGTDRPSCLQRPGSPGWARQLFSPPQHNCSGPTRGCWPFHILSAHLLGARSTPEAGMILLRASLMLCSPFRGGGRSHIGAPSLPKDRREMGAQGEIAGSQKSRDRLGWKVSYEGAQKAISEVPPGPLTHSRPRCPHSLRKRAEISV